MTGKRWGALVGTLGMTMVVACSDATGVNGASSFTANITGATTARLTGSATASAAGDWSRESVVQVTLPNVGPISGIVLSATGGSSSISFLRSGADLTTGTFNLGRPVSSPLPAGGYSAGYTIRQSDGFKLFAADSGSVTLSESGNRVDGTFTVYVSSYQVFPLPTPDQVGKVITPLSSGRSPMTITGTFSAQRN